MNWACLFNGHDWSGCKCNRCGRIRQRGHDWEGCKCRICGNTRDFEHDWECVWQDLGGCDTCPKKAAPGDWGMCMPETGDGCYRTPPFKDVCKRCGATRSGGEKEISH